MLSVSNWLKRQQRFKVIYELNKPDASVVFKGHDFIDVPPISSREYKLTIYSYKETVTTGKIIFRNEVTGEFLYYAISYKSTAPGVINTFDLNTSVRQSVSQEVSIINSLTTPVIFTSSCAEPQITVPHTFTIQPRYVSPELGTFAAFSNTNIQMQMRGHLHHRISSAYTQGYPDSFNAYFNGTWVLSIRPASSQHSTASGAGVAL